MAAAEVLGFVGTRESIPALHEAAVENDLRLAAIAKEAWRKIDPDSFTPSMESAVDMESEMTSRQREGLQRLVELKPDKHQDRVAKMLVRMALSADQQVREDAYAVLPIWGTKDTAPAFIDLLSEKVNPTRRQLAEMALGALKDPRGAAAVARWAITDSPASMDALAEMGPVAEDSVVELLMNDRIDIRRSAVKILKIWGSKQKGLQALLALLTRERERERANPAGPVLERDILDAIATIRERPNIPRRPMTQPNKPMTQPSK